MEKNKVLLTDKVTKDNLKSPTFKKWVMRVLCFACILSLALQLAMCVAPMSASAEESIVGKWVFNDSIDLTSIEQGYYDIRFSYTTTTGDVRVCSNMWFFTTSEPSVLGLQYYRSELNSYYPVYYDNTKWRDVSLKTIVVYEEPTDETIVIWIKANASKVIETVYDFTGEYRIFKPTLDIGFASTQTVQTYQFDFNIYGGYNADYMNFISDADVVQMWYSFTDEGSGGLRMMYRQSFGDESGTWLVPRARIIYFQSNPDDPTFQQWLLDNTFLVAPDSIDILYNTGYDVGFNDGWTNNVIGDTLKAPIEALNSMVLLQTADVTITLGGVIFTMVVLSLLIVFLKKYAGG